MSKKHEIRREMTRLEQRHESLKQQLQQIEAAESRRAREQDETTRHVFERFWAGHWIVHGACNRPWWCKPGQIPAEPVSADEFDALQRLVEAEAIEASCQGLLYDS